MAIGKDPSSPYDEVSHSKHLPTIARADHKQIFMVSSLNHHISILRLTIHDAYTDFVMTGQPPEQIPKEEDWCRPTLRRTQWFDFFDMEQRIEAFRAVWGVMAYLNRPVELKAGEGGQDASMAGSDA
jgi:hypothetical protein